MKRNDYKRALEAVDVITDYLKILEEVSKGLVNTGRNCPDLQGEEALISFELCGLNFEETRERLEKIRKFYQAQLYWGYPERGDK